MFTTLIGINELERLVSAASVRVIDCRFDLADVDLGRRQYRQAHIPGAAYAHLECDLSADKKPERGRHPLPSTAHMNAVFSRLGIDKRQQVVFYDATNGIFAARAWWMLRYLGHPGAAVLDGGWQQWADAGLPTQNGELSPSSAAFLGVPRTDRLVSIDDISARLNLVDAREPARFRGEVEPLDPRAGHIPGAKNHFFLGNLEEQGKFRQPIELQRAFTTSLGKLPDSETVHYCGSGVSACHNILAQVHAGLDEPRLYCGSWSEWCADSSRPFAEGEG
ncbi:MAG: thiosulfate/3-mercaptopyruvate sulfurtransferase [Gammaproteobacteria bacterium]|jgi:thiosulfate/3-mercaptopyruvate sulfurtransferase